MLNINSIKIKDYLSTVTNDTDLRKKLLSIAVALHVAKHQQLPTSEVEAPKDFYNTNVLQSTNKEIYSLNEQVIVDTSLALEIAQGYWMVRYYTLYPSKIPFTTVNEYDLFCKIALTDIYISPDVYKTSNDNKVAIIQLLNILSTM